jgi:DNA (cytosine-5)-methyltransferase 1
MKKIKVGSDFSGVGAFDQSLIRLGIDYETVFACDMDKYARDTFIHNYGEPKYYPMNVYDREIPNESLDIYMTSPPCQAFSLAGKRLGKDDKRGILFFNSHEFIQINKPRFFIFENVKGLLSDDGGKTFQEWVNMLGGKSVNGSPVLFPYEDAVPYHLYWQVLNAKHHGVPQNRERVFLIGIRDDIDNNFRFPKEEPLNKKLKNVLEEEIFEKFYLSEAAIKKCLKSQANEHLLIKEMPELSKCIVAGYYKIPFDGQYLKVESNLEKYYLSEKLIDGFIKKTSESKEKGNGFLFKPKDDNQIGNTILTKAGGRIDDNFIKIKSGTLKGYEEATPEDSINYSFHTSDTRKGRVGKKVAQTLDTNCNQAVWIADFRADEGLRIRKDGISPCMTSSMQDYSEWNPKAGTRNPPLVGYNDKRLNETIAKNELPEGIPMAIDTYNQKVQENSPTLTEPHHNTTRLWDGYRIRRLTPRECFRLMDFPDTFTWNVSDSQAYKQAGNSIVVNVLLKIIKNLNL